MQAGYRWAASISRVMVLLPALIADTQISSAADWQSQLYTDHALAGKLWHVANAEFVTEDNFWSDLQGARYLILGEKHDNPDHHELQLQVLNTLIARDLLSRLTLEMLDSASSEALASLNNQDFSDGERLSAYLNWDTEGWDWDFYGPLVEAAYEAKVPVYAGNITSETVGRVYSGTTPPEIAAVFDASMMERLYRDIDDSHCGLLPESQFPGMVRVQQTREFTMASQLVNSADNKLSLLIAGNYHARHDLGVPNYMLALDDSLLRSEILSLSFMEVEPGEDDPAAYLDQFNAQPAYDYIWFTPAVTNEDYCASLQQQ